MSAGVISLAVSFSRRAGILSGPVALCGFKLVKSFMTPFWWIIIGGISGVELSPISGMLLRSSDVKTRELRVKYVGLGCTVTKGKSITFQWCNSTSIILLVFDIIPEEFWTGFFATYYVVNI